MIHVYKCHCWTPDGRHLIDTQELSGDDVAAQSNGGRGDRLAFLELVNKWNRIGVCAQAGSPRYLYLAEVTSA